MLTAGLRWAPDTLPMNRMIAITISPGATTAAVRLIVSGNAWPIMPPPAATSTRKNVPSNSENSRRHSCDESWKSCDGFLERRDFMPQVARHGEHCAVPDRSVALVRAHFEVWGFRSLWPNSSRMIATASPPVGSRVGRGRGHSVPEKLTSEQGLLSERFGCMVRKPDRGVHPGREDGSELNAVVP